MKFLLCLLVFALSSTVWAEPRELYSELYAQLRGAEADLGILERAVTSKSPRNIQQLDRTTQALSRLESVWAGARQRLDAAHPPKNLQLWDQTSQMLDLQRSLATRCAAVVELEYSSGPAMDPATREQLALARADISELSAKYDQVRSQLARRL